MLIHQALLLYRQRATTNLYRCTASLRRSFSGSVHCTTVKQVPPAIATSKGICDVRSHGSVTEEFVHRHIGPNEQEIAEMLHVIGVDSIDEMIEKVIPDNVRAGFTLRPLHPEMVDLRNEEKALRKLQQIAQMNKTSIKSLIGQGFVNATTPAMIRRNILENPAWYTAYTPYQPEISQGRLEALLNFQTMICELTGMDVANASLLDESSAAAEAMLMLYRSSADGKTFLVSMSLHPQTVNVLKTRARFIGISIILVDDIEHPNVMDTGAILDTISEKSSVFDCKVIVASDPLSLCLLKPPSEFGADVVVGSSQRLGLPVGYGGPHAGFLATRGELIRGMAGRIIGRTRSADGAEGLRMTLQTREQHIRREKATSNICTAQALLATISGMFGVYHGPDNLRRFAESTANRTQFLAKHLTACGWSVHPTFFDTLCVKTFPLQADEILRECVAAGYNLRRIGEHTVGITLDETIQLEDLQKLCRVFRAGRVAKSSSDFSAIDSVTESPDFTIPDKFMRKQRFMQQGVFSMSRSETDLMRYMGYLASKDLALNHSMIPLGSCTMKLNSAASLLPILWPEFCEVHPFAPADQCGGYATLARQLSYSLCSLTGFDVCSLQPNSGATGEYAGLVAIRRYQQSIGEGHRNVSFIPNSAHGTNPASAALAGMRIIGLKIDPKTGATDMKHLREMLEKYHDQVSCAIMTYPSTYGLFDENIREICDTIHKAGGLVYVDGANMNAQLGLCSPGSLGADICHLNLHKTFAIPHGGGGPGVGPICGKEFLAPFMPSTDPQQPSTISESPAVVAAAPLGSAMVLPISWMFIAMLGEAGLKCCAQVAVLNANYMRARLAEHYLLKFVNKHGFCGHEFILDVSEFKRSSGVTEEDIAKRLMDYGFHAPTMSWPVPSSLMIEPTESENKAELDRFCDAMIGIRKEIRKIEDGTWPRDNNPLKRSPHTAHEVTASNWERPYERETAAFPAPW